MSFMVPIEFATNGATVAQQNFDAVETRLNRHAGKCRVATAATLPANTRTGNILTANANASINTAGIDSVTTLALLDRVLVKDEIAQANNGIYYILDLGSAGTKWKLKRASDADTSEQVINGLQVWITTGTVNARSSWQISTTDPITLNVTALVWDQVISGASSGTVTSFSAGNLVPLFSTLVATPTTTPNLSFSLTNQTANKIFAGPASAGPSAPTFRSLVSADIPSLPASIITSGFFSLARGGTGADLSGIADGSLLSKSGTALAATGALSGILQGNGASAPTAITGTTNRLARWAASGPYLRDSAIQDDGTTVGIGTSPIATASLIVAGKQVINYAANAVNYGLDIVSDASLASALLLRVGVGGLTNGFTISQDISSNVVFSFIGGGLNVGAATAIASGVVNASTGFRIAGGAASGNVPRGNGTNFVSAQLGSVDLNNTSFITSVSGTAGRISSTGGLNPIVDLIASGVAANTYGSATQVPVFAVDTYGRITSVTNTAISMSLANPNALVGLTAINGSAATAMRSDGAPAINQTIAPTWTGLHTFKSSGDNLVNFTNSDAPGLSSNIRLLWKFQDTDTNFYNAAALNVPIINWNGTSAARDGTMTLDVAVNGTLTSLLQLYSSGTTPIAWFRAAGCDVIIGSDAALSTSATSGFLYLSECAGPPTGVPLLASLNPVPAVYDKTNDGLYVYNGSWKRIGSSSAGTFTGFANPTASIGLTAVNGVATTGMRSDGAPALSQAIVPTWTGLHTFTILDSVTNATSVVGIFTHNSSATPVAGFGSEINFRLKSSNTLDRTAANLDVTWTTATDASRTSRLALSLMNAGSLAEYFRLDPFLLKITGSVNVTSGFQVNGAAIANHVLKSNGTEFIDAALVAADIPGLDAAKIITGQLALARGGTNRDYTADVGGIVYYSGVDLRPFPNPGGAGVLCFNGGFQWIAPSVGVPANLHWDGSSFSWV